MLSSPESGYPDHVSAFVFANFKNRIASGQSFGSYRSPLAQGLKETPFLRLPVELELQTFLYRPDPLVGCRSGGAFSIAPFPVSELVLIKASPALVFWLRASGGWRPKLLRCADC